MMLLMRALVVTALLLAAAPAFGQSRAATERRLSGLQQQISSVERQVRSARGEEATALRALEGLDTEIQLREELVSGYQTQVQQIRGETEVLQRSIARLEQEILAAKDAYQAKARHAYMHGRRNSLALILAAGSINQMLVRARYLQQFASRRRRQVERIESKSFEMRAREQAVQASLQETQRFLQQSQVERQRLAQRRGEREALVAQVRSRRGRLEGELAQRRRDADELQSLVQDLIVRDTQRAAEERRLAAERAAAAEAERAAAAARAEAERIAAVQRRAEQAARDDAARRAANRRPEPRTERPAPTPRRGTDALPPSTAPPSVAVAPPAAPTPAPPSTAPPSTAPPRRAPEPRTAPEPRPEAPPVAAARPAPEPRPAPPPAPAADRPESLTGSFSANRGRLPWPTDGTVTGRFGRRTDPVYGTETTSQGIDIATASGAPARAVFQGTVERVGAMASYGTFVLVSHGDFVTVYGNLSQVVVRQGQTLSAGQTVGRAGTASDRRGSSLFFAVFQAGRATDPLGWLRGR